MTAFGDQETGRAVNRVTQVSLREVDYPGDPTDTHVIGEVLELDHLRGPMGNVRAGALLTMADTVGGMCAGLAVLPGWVVSTNLMLRTTPKVHRGPLALDARVLRVGRNAAVTQVGIRDRGDADALIADGVLTSAVLDPAGGPPDFPRPMVLDVPDSPDPVLPLLDFFGVRPHDASSVALEINETVRNPWGILHGGATAVLVDAAAAHAVGAGATTADVVLHFLRPGRIGPAVARASVLGERPDGHLVHVQVVDAGADDRVMAVAVGTVRTP
ncbi:MAG: hotdog domain-containing protein [Acidimicrobiia bacterium]